MERVNELLERPEGMTDPQKTLWVENQNLANGNLQDVRRLIVRPHHFRGYYQVLVKEWERYHVVYSLLKKVLPQKSEFLSPWRYSNIEKFNKESEDFAKNFSRSDLYDQVKRLALADTKKDKERIRYYRDLIGTTERERTYYFLSSYLHIKNFLLRTFRDPSQMVILKAVVDDICSSCRGVVGDHCRKNLGEEKPIIERLLRRFETDLPDYFLKIKRHKKGVSLPLYFFYDNRVREQLSEMKKWRP